MRLHPRSFLPMLLLTAALSTSAGLCAPAAAIVADHTAVDRHADIPQPFIDLVKRMWVTVPGESHSSGYRIGLALLEAQDSRFQVNVRESGTPEAYTDAYLRFSRANWGDVDHATGWIYGYGEEDWYTSATAAQRTRDGVTYCNTHSLALAATGFGWCWDTTWQNGPGGGTDPVYQVRWAGSSVGGPDGNLRWGLDADDYALTGNHVCMDTYIAATQALIDHCQANGYLTLVFFTTGPVDGGGNTGESGYQRQLKHQRIRDYVDAGDGLCLFDYADILCWSNAGAQNTVSWTDLGGTPRTFQYIHADNMLDLDGTYAEDGDHIGQRGALRLAKAMWWMLARLAGWDGLPPGLSLADPDGGEEWPVGRTRTIRWTATGLTGNVTLELSRNGAPAGTLGTPAAAAGSFDWAISDTLASDSTYTIRVSQGAVADESAGTFTLYLPGDLDDDGTVSAADLAMLACLLAGDDPAVARPSAVDVDDSGGVDAADLVALLVQMAD